MVSELVTATSDLSLSRGARPQTTAEYEQNKLLQSPEDLTLLLMSGESSCSKEAAGIIHTSPEFRHPRQQFGNSPFPSTPLTQETVCLDYLKNLPLSLSAVRALSLCLLSSSRHFKFAHSGGASLVQHRSFTIHKAFLKIGGPH